MVWPYAMETDIALVGMNNLIQNDEVQRDKERLKITLVE
jgi:hypothetical protein